MSLLCARMLLGTTDPKDNSLGWAIIDDITRDYTYTPEQETYQDVLRAYRSEYTSLGRNDLHWAPYYTQSTYADGLKTYEYQMTQFEVNNNKFIFDHNFVSSRDSILVLIKRKCLPTSLIYTLRSLKKTLVVFIIIESFWLNINFTYIKLYLT